MNDKTSKQALARYHAAYDNTTYTDIRRRIIRDTVGPDANVELHAGDTTVMDFMNALIDTCLECCGSSQHTGAHILLARAAAWMKLIDQTSQQHIGIDKDFTDHRRRTSPRAGWMALHAAKACL